MKILELRFRNLNSLYGEWIIDFTDPEYVSNGIFALTGPTGAGKSTILDAICLALYGTTPRLGKITKSRNELMSRQTGDCYAEVLFESQAGRFRCHWEQRRARKKAEGPLQEQEHHISDADTGKPIETKKSLVGGVIEEKTGMDFDRFTRSILLAQGGFDTFLKADIEQKSKILEQITGTEIYSEISRRVHERQRDERERLNLLIAEVSGIGILEPEQENEIQQKLEANRKQESDLVDKSSRISTAMAWLTLIEDLKREILSLTDEATKLQADFEAFKPARYKLEQAIKAATMDGIYATLTTHRVQQSEDQAALKTEEAGLPQLETSAHAQAEALQIAEQRVYQAKENLKAAYPLIQKIRSLDQRIAELAKSVSECSESCKKRDTAIEINKKALSKEREKHGIAQKSRETIEQYLQEHAQDEWLIGGLTGIEEQLANLLARQQEIEKKERDLQSADAALKQALEKLDATSNQCAVRKKALDAATKKLLQGKGILQDMLGDKSLREYRTEKDTLLREMAYMKRIAELEDHRARLEDGQPCPLCGSHEHPYAKGNVPVPDEIEQKIESLTILLGQAEDQETTIKQLEQAETTARNVLNHAEKRENQAENDKKAAETTRIELTGSLSTLRTSFQESKRAVLVKLQQLGIVELPESKISSLLDSLKTRCKEWQRQVMQKTEIEKQIGAIGLEMKRLDAVIETQLMALTEQQSVLEQLKKERTSVIEERKALYGDKKPDNEEIHLNKAIADAEEAEKKAGSLHTELQQKLTTTKAHVGSLISRIGNRKPILDRVETDFSMAFAQEGFTDEKQFLQARLTNEERSSLSSRAKELDNAQTELKAKQKDRETRLSTESAKTLTDKTFEELEPQFRDLDASLKELRDSMSALKHTLRENAAAKERIKEKRSAIEAQKKECHRWEKLHGLIGSADGKKYRAFAQGLTFELMVSHANQQLEQITDRYLLIRDELQPLELNVVDNYQAGEIRSTKNLSGGESFIVSLTLALGLSKMASRKVRVDSLFLDEGFGTLDEETLESALETLSSLQQDGKLIGIISHVSALKERISTKMHITPVSGGRSAISGPGCTKVEVKILT